MARKRQLEEIDDLESVSQPALSACIDGVVTGLSIVKKGKKNSYFDGSVSDGKTKLRIVGFRGGQHKAIKDFLTKKTPLRLEDCQIKPGRRGSKMEIQLKDTTVLMKSPKTFDFSAIDFDTDAGIAINLGELEDMSLYQKVTADVKVLVVDEPVTFSSGVTKQDVTVADRHAVGKVLLWEENVGKLQQQGSYTLKDFVIREYACSRFLGFSQEGSQILPIADMGVVKQLDGEEDKLEELGEAKVIAVMQLEMYRACLRCKGRVEPLGSPFGRCSRSECEMMQRFEECIQQIVAKVMFKKPSGNTLVLHAFGEMVKKLANVSNDAVVSEGDLMSAPPCRVEYNSARVVVGVSR